MSSVSKTNRKAEYGDFQTPPDMAARVCELLASQGINPSSVIEPTCGLGNFLFAALDRFSSVRTAFGLDIESSYIEAVRSIARLRNDCENVRVMQSSFFHAPWREVLESMPDPLLVLGNPPWVTNSALGALGSSNLPNKNNYQNLTGMDARTGKSNFDISEWMMLQIFQWLHGRTGALAMLCKTAVARKVLFHAWRNRFNIRSAQIYRINAGEYFGASVDSCLLVCNFAPCSLSMECSDFSDMDAKVTSRLFGYRDGRLVADVALYDRWKHLEGSTGQRWRSGIKHDCSKIMELQRNSSGYSNGLEQHVDIESDFLFPMLKSSEVANGHTDNPRRWMLVTQRHIGEDTALISQVAPRTWDYLLQNAALLDARGSSIYRGQPPFAIFGVGPYTFAQWKVAVSGLYKKLHFAVVGNLSGKPVVLDDTVNFLPCRSRDEADYLAESLNSEPARAYFSAITFLDAKRPVTVELLRRLDMVHLARELGTSARMELYLNRPSEAPRGQMTLDL